MKPRCPKPESTARGTRVQPAGPLPGGQSMKISEMKAKNLANMASILCKLLLLSSSLPKESHQALFKLCCRIEPISAFSVRCAKNRIAFQKRDPNRSVQGQDAIWKTFRGKQFVTNHTNDFQKSDSSRKRSKEVRAFFDFRRGWLLLCPDCDRYFFGF